MPTSKKINQGLVKLTKKNINDGRLGEKIKSISGSDKVLTKKELIKERRKIIPDDGIGEDIYIFGYGSLLWNPTINYESQNSAKVYGFHRSFCMKTHLGRGSFKNPGLMLGLDKGGSCRGSAYKLNREDAIKNIDILFKREMVTGAYKPKLLKTKLDNDEIILSLYLDTFGFSHIKLISILFIKYPFLSKIFKIGESILGDLIFLNLPLWLG